jgi:hypothetical protein
MKFQDQYVIGVDTGFGNSKASIVLGEWREGKFYILSEAQHDSVVQAYRIARASLYHDLPWWKRWWKIMVWDWKARLAR